MFPLFLFVSLPIDRYLEPWILCHFYRKYNFNYFHWGWKFLIIWQHMRMSHHWFTLHRMGYIYWWCWAQSALSISLSTSHSRPMAFRAIDDTIYGCVCVCQSIRCAAWRVADKFYVIRLIYFATMCQPVLIPNRIDIVSLQSDTIYLYGHNKNMSHAIDL